MTTTTSKGLAASSAQQLVEPLFGAVPGMMDVHTVYVGERLGLYRALADSDTTTSAELAAATATDRMRGKGRSGDFVRLRLSISALSRTWMDPPTPPARGIALRPLA